VQAVSVAKRAPEGSMADETHKLQKDPPEGSRRVIEHELERQARKSGRDPKAAEPKPSSPQEGNAGKRHSGRS
jgi:hypothetical protein